MTRVLSATVSLAATYFKKSEDRVSVVHPEGSMNVCVKVHGWLRYFAVDRHWHPYSHAWLKPFITEVNIY